MWSANKYKQQNYEQYKHKTITFVLGFLYGFYAVFSVFTFELQQNTKIETP